MVGKKDNAPLATAALGKSEIGPRRALLHNVGSGDDVTFVFWPAQSKNTRDLLQHTENEVALKVNETGM